MNKKLLLEGLKKYFVLPLIITVLIMLMVPIYLFLQKDVINESTTSFQQGDSSTSVAENSTEISLEEVYTRLSIDKLIYSPYVMLAILILPVVLGVQLYGNERKSKNKLTDYINDNNISKKEVYVTNIVTGMLLSIVPIIINCIMLVLVKKFAGISNYISTSTIITWTSLGVFSSLLFYIFTFFVGLITKNKALQALYTYGFLFIPVFLVYLLEILLTKVIYGFPGFSQAIINLINQIPAIKVIQMFTTKYSNYTFADNVNLWYVLAYVVVSGIIAFGGYKLLNVKDTEKLQIIGDKIFKYIWIIILGTLMYIALKLIFNTPLIAVIITTIMLLVVYLLKELIVKRKFSIEILKCGKRYYIISLVSIIVVLVLSSNLFGYENAIPNSDEIEYASYTTVYPGEDIEIKYKEEANINALIEKHKNLILAKNNNSINNLNDYSNVYIQYKLKNGKKVIRKYEEILSVTDHLFTSDEYMKQKYAYMYDNKKDVDIIKIAGVYNQKTFTIEANRYENLDLLNELLSYIENDLNTDKVYLPENSEYNQYAEKEGIQIIQVGILDGLKQYSNYLYYLKVKDNYELVNRLQTLINEESELITWEEK